MSKEPTNRLLYVEDDADTRELLEFTLKEKVGEVLIAKNGSEALELFTKHAPKVVLTDIGMPGLDGFELIEKIRSIDEEAEVIVLTAHRHDECHVKIKDLGVKHFLEKPTQIDKLLEIINKVL